MSAKKGSVPPGLRLLDLSLGAGEELDSHGPSSPNGLHPHVGYKGAKRHPPSPYLYDKGRDVHKRLREDVERAMDDAMLEIHGTPSWALFASKEITHSGESPLFVHKYLSPYKLDGSAPPVRPQRSSAKSLPPTHNGHQYYRPNRTHQYLTATELRDQTEAEVQLRLGRPTRTSLLRARQRSNSAPMNAYEIRREMTQRIENVKNNCPVSSSKEVFEFVTEDGMTHHAFLTGARYNRAHCLDSRVLTLYGVYMPRHNPTAYFFTGTPRMMMETPGTPPDSPRSDLERGTQSAPVSRPRTAPNYGRRPLPAQAQQVNGHASGAAVNGQAPHWSDANASQQVANGRYDNVHEETLVWPYGLGVKGRGMGGGRSHSTTLPSVTGISVSRMRQVRQSTAEALAEALDAPPTTAMPTPNLNERSEEEEEGRVSGDSPLAIRTPTTPLPAAPEQEQEEQEEKKSARPNTVDHSIMVPSVGGDLEETKDSSLEESPQESPTSKEKDGGGGEGAGEEEKAAGGDVRPNPNPAAPEEKELGTGDNSNVDADAREATAVVGEGVGEKGKSSKGNSQKDGAKPADNVSGEDGSNDAPGGTKERDTSDAEKEREKHAKPEKNPSLFVRNSAQAPEQSGEKAPAQSEETPGGDSAFFITEAESEKAPEKTN